MNNIKLVTPSIKFKTQILDYKKEFEDNNESMDGTANLANYNNIEDWLDSLKDNSKEETVRTGLVPASTYLALIEDEDIIIGMIDIRHRLNDFLFNFGGHIGYSVKKSERLKGYAKEILHHGLKECKKINIDNVLITCDKENIGSLKTIVKNGGKLENEVSENGKTTQRYWITV
ncbi:MAG: GNAT family N-acetyltransferase [Spirochaetaceae bacterium]